jgi:hypothetical protein
MKNSNKFKLSKKPFRDPEGTNAALIDEAHYAGYDIYQFDGGKSGRLIRVFKDGQYVGNKNNKSALRDIGRLLKIKEAPSWTTTIPNNQQCGQIIIDNIKNFLM